MRPQAQRAAFLAGQCRRAGGRGALRDGEEIRPVGAGEVIVDVGRAAGHFRLLAEFERGSVREGMEQGRGQGSASPDVRRA